MMLLPYRSPQKKCYVIAAKIFTFTCSRQCRSRKHARCAPPALILPVEYFDMIHAAARDASAVEDFAASLGCAPIIDDMQHTAIVQRQRENSKRTEIQDAAGFRRSRTGAAAAPSALRWGAYRAILQR